MGTPSPCPALEATETDALHQSIEDNPRVEWPVYDQSKHVNDVAKDVRTHADGCPASHTSTQDHFIIENGEEFAGRHYIFDFWGASQLDDLKVMEAALRKAVQECGATLLHIHLHHFTPNGGISGVAVLAESHISVHTWPERDFAAFDVFMCGDAQPHLAIPVLEAFFKPTKTVVKEEKRGLVAESVDD